MLRFSFLWVLLLYFPSTYSGDILYCTLKDCYTVEEEVLEAHTQKCLYESEITMFIVHWKRINKWKQVQYIGGNKVLNCLPRIPQMYRSGEETAAQLKFLDRIKCQVHNLNRDPVLQRIDYFDFCMGFFINEDY